METLYFSAYIYGRPLARKLESLLKSFPPKLSSLNCNHTNAQKSTDYLASKRSSKYTESIISHHRRASLAQDSDTNTHHTDEKSTQTTAIMADQLELRKRIWKKYENHGDSIREFDSAFKDSYWVDPAYAPNAADAEIDLRVKGGLLYLQGTREEMNLLITDEPIDFDVLDDLLREAFAVHQCVTFQVRRHYQGKDEGLRLPREHNFTDLELQTESCFLRGVACSSARMIRSAIERNSAELMKRRDQRLKALDKTLDRVEKIHKLAVMASAFVEN